MDETTAVVETASAIAETAISETGNVADEVVETTAADRPFLSTPLDDYSVTEGLLLTIMLLLIAGFIWKMIREAF